MAVQPNVVLLVAGLIVAGATGSYTVGHWQELTGLRDWEAIFQEQDVILPAREFGVAHGSNRTERYEGLPANTTLLSVDLTWQDPPLVQPEITLRVTDPLGRLRGTASQRGGIAGIHFDMRLIQDDDVPQGRAEFQARNGEIADRDFNDRWPAHPESQGNWTLEIRSTVPPNTPPGQVVCTLQVAYEYYTGFYREIPQAVR